MAASPLLRLSWALPQRQQGLRCLNYLLFGPLQTDPWSQVCSSLWPSPSSWFCLWPSTLIALVKQNSIFPVARARELPFIWPFGRVYKGTLSLLTFLSFWLWWHAKTSLFLLLLSAVSTPILNNIESIQESIIHTQPVLRVHEMFSCCYAAPPLGYTHTCLHAAEAGSLKSFLSLSVSCSWREMSVYFRMTVSGLGILYFLLQSGIP